MLKHPLLIRGLALILMAGRTHAAEFLGPLRVHPANPRYFTNDSGRAIYLTGSHTWTNLQDVSGYKELTNLDELGGFKSHLEWLRSYHHNFIRLWILEHAWDPPENATVSPLPWPRTGPGHAFDGKPKFDLTKFDPAYFERLRSRVIAAGDRGFYVSIMLFDSWSVEHQGTWKGHPFHASNNINDINGDPDNDGIGIETHMLRIPAVTKLQEAYARKVVDTVNDLDNVLYEISNESEYGADWHNHLARVIQEYEAKKPKRHPVGITGGGPTNGELFAGPADWISPTAWTDPPASDGRKVVIIDTDHIGHVSRTWIWRSFLRGHNPILMDWMHKTSPWYRPADQDAMRKAMGQTLKMANRMDLAAMTPRNDLASTGYCLANPGQEYLVYLPKGGEVTVDLSAATGELSAEWVHPIEGTITGAEPAAGGDQRTLKAPFPGDAVVHLWTPVKTGRDGSATDAAPYLAAVRQFADMVLTHGRDTYGKPTPLFVDGLNVDTLEPVKWKWADGKEWVLCNLASQQGLFRTLDGLSRLTGEPRYKGAAIEALRYAFDHLRYGTENNGGLLAWGGHLAYNATDDVITGNPDGRGRIHELKCFFPHYELMGEADPKATRQLIENMWNGHVLDWARLDFNRHASPKKLGALWQNEYRGGAVFFDGQGLTFHNAGSDFYYAAGMLSKLDGDPGPLVWARRLAHRYVETRDPRTGLGGFQFSQCQTAWCDDVGKIRGDRAQYQYGDDFKGHRVVEGTLFPCYGDTPEVEPQVGRLLLGEQLGDAGRDFTQWAVEEMTAWGKSAYCKEDNAFIPMLTDGTSMEGYVCMKDGYFGPKGRVLRAGHPGPAHLWVYALAFRLSGDGFLWEMARNIAQGNGWGDIGQTARTEPSLQLPDNLADPFLVSALLELHRAGGNAAFLNQAQTIGQNILKQRVQKGWFVSSRRHLFCRLSNNEAQALLHLAAALLGKQESVPAFTGATPFFHAVYGGQTLRSYDTAIIYGRTR